MYIVKPPEIAKHIYSTAKWNFSREEEKLYLTFDDGPDPEVTPQILTILKQYNAKATFFCSGKRVEKYPAIYNEIIQQGHSVGNHTYNHLNGYHSRTADYLNDIMTAGILIHSNLFRPPYGKIKRKQYKLLKKDYKIIMWDVLSCDFDRNILPPTCINNVIRNVRNGSIIVFHDSQQAKKNVLIAVPEVLKYYTEKHIEFSRII